DLELSRMRNSIFALTWTVIHWITETSPLYRATPASLEASEVEIIVSVVGLDESLSQTVHARHSFLPDEIAWGARFVDVISRLPDGRRQVDLTHFHEIVENGGSLPPSRGCARTGGAPPAGVAGGRAPGVAGRYAPRPRRRLLGRPRLARPASHPRSRPPRVPRRVDRGGVRLRRGHAARVHRGADRAHPSRLRHHADPGTHAGDDRDDGHHAGSALRRPHAARSRRLRTAGRRGMARRRVRQTARPHARVRRDRASDLGAREAARAPGSALPDPVSRS